MDKRKLLQFIRNKLIVSVQGVGDEPTNDAYFLAVSARAVVAGGAKILRCSQIDHIRAIKKETEEIPIIGLVKRISDNSEVFITPNKSDIDDLVNLGIDGVALDATKRSRENDEKLCDIVAYAKKKYPNLVLMADCATEDDVDNAIDLGFDIISTTLYGYTNETKGMHNPDNNYEFFRRIKGKHKDTNALFIIEGGIHSPDKAKAAMAIADSIVVGSAITRPHTITTQYIDCIEES